VSIKGAVVARRGQALQKIYAFALVGLMLCLPAEADTPPESRFCDTLGAVLELSEAGRFSTLFEVPEWSMGQPHPVHHSRHALPGASCLVVHGPAIPPVWRCSFFTVDGGQRAVAERTYLDAVEQARGCLHVDWESRELIRHPGPDRDEQLTRFACEGRACTVEVVLLENFVEDELEILLRVRPGCPRNRIPPPPG
jgi:hypothetical protein